MIFSFNRTIKYILSNYIPHESIICDDQNSAWLMKKLIHFNVTFIVTRIPEIIQQSWISPKWIEVFNQSYQRKVLLTYLEKNDKFFDQY